MHMRSARLILHKPGQNGQNEQNWSTNEINSTDHVSTPLVEGKICAHEISQADPLGAPPTLAQERLPLSHPPPIRGALFMSVQDLSNLELVSEDQ